MTVVSLHPDDLLDREARGSLSSGERAHLDQHLAACRVCRMERVTRQDFAAELAEVDEPRLSGALLAALGTLTAAPGPLPTNTAIEPPVSDLDAPAAPIAPDPRGVFVPRRRRFPVWLLAAAAVLVVGVAGAAGASRVFGVFTPDPAPAAPATTTVPVEVSKPVASRPRKNGGEAAKPVDSDPQAIPAPTEGIQDPPIAERSGGSDALVPRGHPDPGALAPGAVTNLEAPAAGRAVVPPAALAGQRSSPPSVAAGPLPQVAAVAPPIVVPPPVAAPPVPPARSPAAIISEGNEARRRGEDDRAITLYRELERAHPDSPEARVARATLGRLLLERGQASAALEKFDQYLERKGALSEDVLVERAQSLQRLGRRADERAAWQSVLRAYPRSAYATKARQRIEALDRP